MFVVPDNFWTVADVRSLVFIMEGCGILGTVCRVGMQIRPLKFLGIREEAVLHILSF